jgi:hypothetical protein
MIPIDPAAADPRPRITPATVRVLRSLLLMMLAMCGAITFSRQATIAEAARAHPHPFLRLAAFAACGIALLFVALLRARPAPSDAEARLSRALGASVVPHIAAGVGGIYMAAAADPRPFLFGATLFLATWALFPARAASGASAPAR